MRPEPISRWFELVKSGDASRIEDMLTDDAVFLSPAVHKPQEGKALVAKYLRAAMAVFGKGGFRYTNEWFAGNSAVLEFEAEIDGVQINGADFIHWNAEGRIHTFKVMIRPFKALNTIVALMGKLMAEPS
jgi:ketosteroid isomerase-like protein